MVFTVYMYDMWAFICCCVVAAAAASLLHCCCCCAADAAAAAAAEGQENSLLHLFSLNSRFVLPWENVCLCIPKALEQL